MIDKVLLMPEEKDEVWKAEVKKAGKPSLIGKVWEKALVKAQCLKLLEWLRGRCTEHPQYDEEVGGSKRKFYPLHQDCPECMLELESELKEG